MGTESEQYRDYAPIGGCPEETTLFWGFPDQPGDPGYLCIIKVQTRSHSVSDNSWRLRLRLAWLALMGQAYGDYEFMTRQEAEEFLGYLRRAIDVVWPSP